MVILEKWSRFALPSLIITSILLGQMDYTVPQNWIRCSPCRL